MMRWLAMLCGVLVGCGPSVSTEDVELAEICGAQGPVQLLEVEVPTGAGRRATWGTSLVGNRRLAAWYDTGGDELEDTFGAYLLDPCGGSEVELSKRQYPLQVGDLLFVCNPLDGSIRAMDLDTGEPGEMLATGYDCNPTARYGSTLMLRNWDANVWGVLRPDGVRLLPIELDEFNQPSTNLLRIAEYLSVWGLHPSVGEGEEFDYLLWNHQERLVIIELATGDILEAPEGTRWMFGIEDGRDMLLVLEPDTMGISRTIRLDTIDAEPRPGPQLADVVQVIQSQHRIGAAVLTAESVFLPDRAESFPRPGFIEPEGLTRLDETRFMQQSDARIIVWDAVSGERLVDMESPGYRCGNLILRQEILEGGFSDDEHCLTRTHWLIPLDGSLPRPLVEYDSNQTIGKFAGNEPFGFIASAGRELRDLELLDFETGDTQQIAPHIDGLATGLSHVALRRHVPGEQGFLEFYVREGDRAGLWIIGVPQAW